MPNKNPDERRAYLREYMKKRRREDPEFKARQYALVRKLKATAQERCKQIVAEWQAKGCAICSEIEPACFTFHHLDRSRKDLGIAQICNRGWTETRLLVELQKCICLCANCHRKVHAGHLTVPSETHA